MDFEPIPGPRGLPFLGNMLDLRDEEAPLRAFERLADTYGPIFRLRLGGTTSVCVASAEMMKEVMDEKRFLKTAIPGLGSGKHPNGLIVAGTLDPDWEQAHRILRPAFGPLKIEDMFDSMKDIANQMIIKWARFGENEDIALTEDFSNLTLDTIALCTMDYRFNSFYRDGAHPYVAAMNTLLGQVGQAATTIPIISQAISMVKGGPAMITPEDAKQASAFMDKTAKEIIESRRNKSTRKTDFLDTLLFGKDPKTGEVMRDELIQEQMSSFLVAGHETTSGLLSFTVIKLLQNPETYKKAQAEVDRVVGSNPITLDHIRHLKYIYAALQETLRLIPTAPIISKIPHPNRASEITTLGGKYKIDNGVRVRLILGKCMTDPKVFGEDAQEYNPDRMLESNPDYERIEPYWRPFSEGSRACLGRPFSLQEAVLALALVLQNFDLRLADPMYNMRIKHAITIKPIGLNVRASLRHGMTPADLEQKLHTGESSVRMKKAGNQEKNEVTCNDNVAPLTILYGTNTGTCLALAQRLAAEAASKYGFTPDVKDMDAAVGRLSTAHPTIIITSSYEGQPPDNALQFVQHLESMEGEQLKGVQFAVFGCGHRDWRATHHRIPKLVNELMAKHGAERVADIGLSDAANGNIMADFEAHLDKILLPELKKLSPRAGDAAAGDEQADIQADISTGERVALLHQDLQVGTVKDVRVLTDTDEQPEKRHIEIELPPGATYECGDYLAVLPQSPEINVRAVMSHFGLPADATITLRSPVFAPLPLNTSLSITDLLRNYFELAKPLTPRTLTLCLAHTTDAKARALLTTYLSSDTTFATAITTTQTSLLTLLRTHPTIALPFPAFLASLPPLNIRQYSISSSPLSNPHTCTLTYSVLASCSPSPFHGVASTYLATLSPGDRIQISPRRTSKQTFRLPLNDSTPILMFAAGSGIAPFRGFIQQRFVQLSANLTTRLAPAYLFFGCRKSKLYAAELEEWEKAGAVKVFYSFSQKPEESEGCAHVADRMAREAEEIIAAWNEGARAYVCGNRGFAESVGVAAKRILEERLERRRGEGWSEEEVGARREAVLRGFSERAADDVFD